MAATSVLVLGDSYVRRLAQHLDAKRRGGLNIPSVTVRYHGLGGARLTGDRRKTIARYADDVFSRLPSPPDVVFLHCGSNELSRSSPHHTARSIAEFSDQLLYRFPSMKIVVGGLLPRWNARYSDFNQRVEITNGLLREECARCTHRKTYSSVKGMKWARRANYCADGVHLSQTGNELLARSLHDAIIRQVYAT
ncbi:hypothetical protein CAPTEDRAFT_190791 [Capitella teleta]|uniref:SGNH hydrolase-type esterase domain-containing protein n=1 Tax=Capitella teleta TaxID=283909 RepID=R7TV92_CAPTE|nr:hypothetical protein CAPTEDRAFT_190791 [Capitella teleta]|eukprot:ELT95376.1 hypothetical protein CAPTEDRAFT_190791 [Capitella teleta]